MKIMMVTPYFYPKVGGLENYALNIAKGLKRQGHEVFIVTSNHEGKERTDEKVQGLRVIRLPRLFKLSNTPINPAWCWQLKKIIRIEKPDIINAHTPVPFIADMAERVRGKVPFVLTYQNDLVKSSPLPNALAKTYNSLFTKSTLRRSDSIIASSQYYVDSSPYLKKWKSKIDIVSPGVDVKRFNSKVDKKWLKEKYPGKKIVLFVGNLEKTHAHKGVDVLIRALAKAKKSIPNIQLVAVGEGDGVLDYEAIVRACGIEENVSFPGFIPDVELPLYYAGADIFVLPSTNKAEGFGMVIIEAAACGTPSIGTKVGGIPFAIQAGKTGVLVKPDSPNSLSRQLINTLTSSKTLNFYGQRAMERATTDYDWVQKIQSTNDILAKAAKPLIVQITPSYPPALGGMEQRVRDLSQELANSGWNVRVVTSDKSSYPHSEKVNSNLRVDYLSSKEILQTPIIWRLPFVIFRLPKHTLVHIHVAVAFAPELSAAVCRLRRIPYIAHVRLDTQPSSAVGKLVFPIYKNLFTRYALRHAAKIIVLTDDYKNSVAEKYGLDVDNIIVIPNATYFPLHRQGSNILSTTPKLLLVGRLSSQKNIELAINAIAELKRQNIKVELWLAGDGQLERSLKNLTRDLKLRNQVKFLGRVESEKLIKFYQDADMVIQTSFEEGFSSVLIEAMASGTPLIASDIQGTRSIVKNAYNGLLIDPRSVKSLTQAVKQLLQDDSLRESMVQNALNDVKKYNWSTIVSSTGQLYEEVL